MPKTVLFASSPIPKKGDTDKKLIGLFKFPAKKLDEWKRIVNKRGLSLTSHTQLKVNNNLMVHFFSHVTTSTSSVSPGESSD